MANIIGEPFKDYVCKQINLRQKIHGKGIGEDQRKPSDLVYFNSKTAWVKLASGIFIEPFRITSGGKDEEINDDEAGVMLAKKNILFGGIANLQNNKTLKQRGTYDVNTISNIWDHEKGVYNVNANLSSNITGEFGLVPMPGITNVEVKCLNRGSIKKATVDIKCYSPEQFQILNLLYLRIGYTMLLEWGWSPYLDNNGELQSSYSTLIEREFFSSNTLSHLQFLGKIGTERAAKNGNYDGLLCKVTNFTWTFSNDGSYDIQLSLISLGDVVESLKTNISPSYPMFNYINTVYRLYNTSGVLAENYPPNPVENTISAYLFLNEIHLSDDVNPNGIDSGTFEEWEGSTVQNLINDIQIKLPGYFVPPPSSNTFTLEPTIDGDGFATLAEAQQWVATNYPLATPTNLYISDFSLFGTAISELFTNIQSICHSVPELNAWLTNGGTTQEYAIIETYGAFLQPYIVFVKVVVDDVKIDVSRKKEDVIYINYNNQEDDLESINPDGFYMRLGHLLEFINNNVTPRIQEGNEKIIEIDYSSTNNLMYIFPYQFSLDPRVCVVNPGEIIGPSTVQKKMFWNLPNFKNTKNGYGYIMNIYVSHNQVRDCIEDNLDDKGNLALYSFFECLCTKINKALGGVNNLEPVLDEEEGILRIIDSSYNPKEQTDCYTLELYGYKENTSNFIHDVEIKTEITNDFATMATVGSTAGGYVKGTENTMFSKWNKGLTDRYKEKLIAGDKNSRESKNPNGVEEPNKMYIQKIWYSSYSVWGCTEYDLENYNILTTFSTTLGLSDEIIDQNISIASEFYRYCHYEIQRYYNKQYASSTNGFIPISLGVTMEGLSGIKIYNEINVDTRFLPSDYLDSLKFIIKGVNHSIKDGKWETSLETIVIADNETDEPITPVPKLSKYGSRGKGAIEEVIEFYSKESNAETEVLPLPSLNTNINDVPINTGIIRDNTTVVQPLYNESNPFNPALKNNPFIKKP